MFTLLHFGTMCENTKTCAPEIQKDFCETSERVEGRKALRPLRALRVKLRFVSGRGRHHRCAALASSRSDQGGLVGILDVLLRIKPQFGRPLLCTFCGRQRSDTNRFISGPKLYACETCVEAAVLHLQEPLPVDRVPARCRCCGRVPRVVPFADTVIVDVCAKCIREMHKALADAGPAAQPAR
jgi:hypothetical protein